MRFKSNETTASDSSMVANSIYFNFCCYSCSLISNIPYALISQLANQTFVLRYMYSSHTIAFQTAALTNARSFPVGYTHGECAAIFVSLFNREFEVCSRSCAFLSAKWSITPSSFYSFNMGNFSDHFDMIHWPNRISYFLFVSGSKNGY